jgi:hypothetical protein
MEASNAVFTDYDLGSDTSIPLFRLPERHLHIQEYLETQTAENLDYADIDPTFEDSDLMVKYQLLRLYLIKTFPGFRFESYEDYFVDRMFCYECSFFMTTSIGDFQIDSRITISIDKTNSKKKPIRIDLIGIEEDQYYPVHCHFIPNTTFHLPSLDN